MPFLPVNCSSIAAAIGDMRMGQYSGQSATELDSHANMAVAFDANVSGEEKETPGGPKKSIKETAVGTTGVELRYYKKDEFVKLSKGSGSSGETAP